MRDLKTIMQQYVDAMSGHNINRVRELLHSKYSYTSSDGRKQKGIQAGINIATMYMNAFPDLKFNIKNIFTVGNVVVTEFICHGTQKGKIMDIAPTGRKIELPVCDIVEVRDGKIYAEREYYDTAEMMQQLGIQPKPGLA